MRKFFKFFIVYEKDEIIEPKTKLENWLSIDLGLNNFCTITSNCFRPIIINGKHIKSINQFYNKKKSKIQSKLKKENKLCWSNQLE
jgi:putative transposase